MPRADGVPFFHFETRNVPSTTNALGIKGAGEAGTIGAAPAALNAVTDALYRAYGIRHIEMPATPLRVWSHSGSEIRGLRQNWNRYVRIAPGEKRGSAGDDRRQRRDRLRRATRSPASR